MLKKYTDWVNVFYDTLTLATRVVLLTPVLFQYGGRNIEQSRRF